MPQRTMPRRIAVDPQRSFTTRSVAPLASAFFSVIRSRPMRAAWPVRKLRVTPPARTTAVPSPSLRSSTVVPGPSRLERSCVPVPSYDAAQTLPVQPKPLPPGPPQPTTTRPTARATGHSARGSRIRGNVAIRLAAFAGLAATALALPAPVYATSASTRLRLNGGDVLEADAFHCTTYFRSCTWQTSAKLLGIHPARASWIQNSAEIQAHGIVPTITLGKSSNVQITFKSRSLVKTRWRNTNSWLSWSGGTVSPSFSTAWVSTRSTASAYHRIFGGPQVQAYAGAI